MILPTYYDNKQQHCVSRLYILFNILLVPKLKFKHDSNFGRIAAVAIRVRFTYYYYNIPR